MRRILQIFLFLLLYISNLFAQEDLYSYKFNLDTTITGDIEAEGNIFPNCESTLISYYYTFKSEQKSPSIAFLNENFEQIDKIEFDSPQISFLHTKPLVFDFDGDSYDEVVFVITDSDILWCLYYDPTNNPQIKTKIFELPIKLKNKKIFTQMAPAQLDKDRFYELIITISEPSTREFSISGMWGIDVEKKRVIWKNLSAENLTKSKPINIETDSLSYIVYSSAGRTSVNSLAFSNNYYFFSNRFGERTSYNENFETNNSVSLDSLAVDYSIDSNAVIRAIDSNKNTIWERKVGGKNISTKIDTIRIDNQKKILFAVYTESSKVKHKSFLEIVNPRDGKVENRIVFQNKLRSLFLDENRIYVSFNSGKITELDFELNILNVSYSPRTNARYNPIARIKMENSNILLAREGTGTYQNLVVLNNELNIVSKIGARGVVSYLAKLKYVTVYKSGERKTNLYSIQIIPWYNRLSPTLLKNLSISFLLILLVTMLLWINTLRVSSKKIKKQKKEIEETHAELKETTAKLIRSEKLAVYGTIASGIAHEINSPLGAIINSAQRIKNNPDADLEKNITLIEKAGKRSKAIIEKLLVNTRKTVDDKTNLVDVLDDWSELSLKQFINMGITFNSTINCNKLLAISSTELNQILTNILFNARDAITENNSTLKEISFSSQMLKNNCQILIKDTGPGFCKEKLENPFEAFETTKERGKGTGLGLWIVKSILENINGTIQIRNYEKGAEVEILIPLFEEKT